MTVFQAVLLAAFYWFTNNYCFITRYAFGRPIVIGLFVGLVLGDIQTGAIVGATIQLAYIGVMFVGGSIASDTGMAAILGCSAAIIGGLDPEAALAVAVPIGLVGGIIHYTRMTYFSFFVRWSDKLVKEGKEDKLWLSNTVIPQITLFIFCFVPAFLACYYGVDAIATVVNALSGGFYRAISVMAGMLPAIGIAITLSLVYKEDAKPFFFLGFLLSALFGLNLLKTCIVIIVLAVIYMGAKGGFKKAEGVEING